MLTKMIKYDLKSSAKIFLLVHAAFILLCLMGRFFFVSRLDFSEDPNRLLMSITVFFSLIIFLISAVNLCTCLQVAFRFYRNLFSREGYLTWALPLSALKQLWAKIISGYIVVAADCTIIFLGMILLVTCGNVTESYKTIAPEVNSLFGISISQFTAYIFVFSLISGICTVILTYFCVAVGQLFSGHRVLFAFVVYLITTFITEIISLAVLFIYNFVPGNTAFTDASGLVSYIFDIISVTLLLMAVLTILQYAATHYIMTRKINLM